MRRRRLVPVLALMALCVSNAGAPRAPAQAEGARPAPMPTAADDAVARALERDPDALGRAAAGAWEGFFDPGRQAALLARAAEGARRALADAEVAYRLSDYPRALERLHAGLRAAPDLPPAWLVLATTYFRLQRYGDARTAFERFLAVAPGEAWRTQGLAHCHYSLGDYAAARAHYERVLAVVPESLEARRGLGLALWRLGEEDAALEALAAVSAAAPERFEAQLWYGRVLFDCGDAAAALPLARRATRLAGHDPRGWFLLLECLWARGEEEEAARVEVLWRERDAVAQERRRVGAELRLAPRDWPRLRRAVELAARVRDVDAVMTLLPRLLRARPATVAALSLRLYALGLLEELEAPQAALAVARRIEAEHPAEADAWRALEAFYARAGDRGAQARAGAAWRRLEGDGR